MAITDEVWHDGDPCPKCATPMVKKPDQFHLFKVGLLPGIVCETCPALRNSQEWVDALEAKGEPLKEVKVS